MPRVKGKVNYKKEVLLQVVREVLPSGALGWEEVSRIYQERSSEGERRNGEDVKRHWQEKCCNRFMKPTHMQTRCLPLCRRGNHCTMHFVRWAQKSFQNVERAHP